MSSSQSDAETLRNILDHVRTPELLDAHPWTSRPFVRDAVERNQHLQSERPGQQLIAALAELFSETRPSTPPRRGKRLDTRWGEFGLLAALYFGPYRFGAPAPTSLRDAWGRIDQSILLYVNGHPQSPLSQSEVDSYKLVGDEPQVAPISTLSDWHCKGIQRLADSIPARENYLKNPLADRLSSEHSPDRIIPESHQRKRTSRGKVIFIGVTLVAMIALALGGYQAQQVTRQLMTVRDDMAQLQALKSSNLDLENLTEIGAALAKTRQDFDRLQNEVEPVLWVGPWLGWVPVYGGDLASSREILQLADLLLESTETVYLSLDPLLTAISSDTALDPAQMIALLGQAQPDLLRARQSLDQAVQVRAGLRLERLSPQTRSVIEDVDTLLPLLEDGLAVGAAFPHLMGAADDGPKTYLLLAQNEDELRPTGGFITAVGTLVVQNGEILRLNFVDSGELENWEYPYPAAPWQLEQYMNSPVLILRDANWFPDFPTSALYVESLYAYQYSHSVDGVIAFDQHMLVMILKALGPIHVEGENDLIDANSVVTYMRSSKSPPANQPLPADWSRKGFMDKIAKAMLEKMFQDRDIRWRELGYALLQGLNQRHLLLQVDNATLAPVLAHYNWDGRLQREEGDFLMVVDSNIGFNKTNAVVGSALSYDVDLRDLENPLSSLTVIHQNNALGGRVCNHWDKQRLDGEQDYPINDCYWNYMRVYVPSATKLLQATPQNIPDRWMILNHGVHAPVDVLDEGIEGLQAFGTLMILPGGKSQTTRFQFSLPGDVLTVSADGTQINYSLHIKKQPGTLAIPIVIGIQFPNGATLESAVPGAVVEGSQLLLKTELRTDLDLLVRFALK